MFTPIPHFFKITVQSVVLRLLRLLFFTVRVTIVVWWSLLRCGRHVSYQLMREVRPRVMK